MSKIALLVIDVQKGILARIPNPELYVRKVAHTVTAARTAGVKIIQVTVSFRPGHPECHPRNKTFGTVAANNLYIVGTDEVSVPAELTSEDSDVAMIKKRVSAFCGTDLDVVLRGLQTEKVVLAGLSTSGAILSTMKEAVDRDFEVVVLRDLCLDPDEEVHRVIMDKVFARHAEVVESEAWLKGLAV